jgi:predicted cupin superfamily sugar epimerase
MPLTAKTLIDNFNLLPHPEGGYYRETYRSSELISQTGLPARFPGERAFATAIYFLLETGNFSAFHRIKSEECWHFYAGDALHVHAIHPDGQYELIKLGNDIEKGETFQAVIPLGAWFASETAAGGNFSFVGCTVAPGFDFADFELAKREELSALFPGSGLLIEKLCRG